MTAGVSWRAAPFGWAAGFLTLAALFLGFDLNHPIALWDESRVLSNALEMNRTGFSLVTTYGWRPDLWNTKPPLAIWLIVLSIRVFGTHEWAMRLPSLLAALGAAAMTLAFAWRQTRSRFVTFCTAFLLVFSGGFYGYHAAWSADYDALLGFFTTVYIFALFEALHRLRPAPVLVLSCALAVALACLTKGVAGLLPGIGVAAYVVASRRHSRLWKSPWYVAGGVIASVLVAGFYLLREQAGAGYLAAVMRGELGGRYLQVVRSHDQSPAYYLYMLVSLFAVPPALLALAATPWLRWPSNRSKAFLIYGAYVCGTLLVVLSLGRTKIYWYLVPIYPVISLMTAVALDRVRRLRSFRIGMAPMVAAAAAFAAIAIGVKIVGLPRVMPTPTRGYGRAFADVSRSGFRRIIAIDRGVRNDEGFQEYTPILHAYAIIWRGRGLGIDRFEVADLSRGDADAALLTCDPSLLRWVHFEGRNLTRAPRCVAAPLRQSRVGP